MSIQRRMSARRLRRFQGRRVAALVEGPSKENELVWEARLEGMAPEIDGKLYLTDLQPPGGGRAAVPGDLATVEITKAHDYDLVGRVVHVSEAVAPRRARPEATPDPMPRIATGAALRVLA
jgi:ribosomal protein S12 methylthiotransferase